MCCILLCLLCVYVYVSASMLFCGPRRPDTAAAAEVAGPRRPARPRAAVLSPRRPCAPTNGRAKSLIKCNSP